MDYTLAIIGRPNVGKSTLFNTLTRSKQALVADFPGLTRDRQYGYCSHRGRHFIVIDTGGIADDGLGLSRERDVILAQLNQQTLKAIEEADALLFLVDAQSGLTSADQTLALLLRRYQKPIYLLINKIDHQNKALALADFSVLGLNPMYYISATQGSGCLELLGEIHVPQLEHLSEKESQIPSHSIQFAIVGRPNVGKSTLVNRILGQERMIVSAQEGTTRDSVAVPFEREGVSYVLVDTAGVRRRSRIHDRIEQFSVAKTLQTISRVQVVIFLIDAQRDLGEQDLRLLRFTLDLGRSLVIGVNKWDGLSDYERSTVKTELDRRLAFIDFAKVHFISAFHGTGVGHLFHSIKQAYRSASLTASTSDLTQILEQALEHYPPPLGKGHTVKLHYAHLKGHHPLTLLIHGRNTQDLSQQYQRYLARFFRDQLKMLGAPVILEFKNRTD